MWSATYDPEQCCNMGEYRCGQYYAYTFLRLMLEYQAVGIAGDLGVAEDANQMVLGSNDRGSHPCQGIGQNKLGA